MIVVSVLFPLGSLYFGFVQQRRAAVTQTDLADDAMEMRRRIQQAQYEAQLAEAQATKRAAQARGAVNVFHAGVDAARQGSNDSALARAWSLSNSHDDDLAFDGNHRSESAPSPLAHANGHSGRYEPQDFVAEDDDLPF